CHVAPHPGSGGRGRADGEGTEPQDARAGGGMTMDGAATEHAAAGPVRLRWPKPPGSRWTDEQWRAIAAADNNILVAAAAGSGKTAVLVERIIRTITDDVQPVDVDRLLVVTFTNAA